MRRITIEWDEDAIEHIWRHRVEPEEVEEVLQERYIFRRGRGGTYYVLGRGKVEDTSSLCFLVNPLAIMG